MSFVWTYPGVVDSWHDGDTPRIHVKLTPSVEWHGVAIRVDGINAPELSAAGGVAARDYATSIAPAGTHVTLICSRQEKYGRLLAKIVLASGEDFGTVMIAEGHAVAYLP